MPQESSCGPLTARDASRPKAARQTDTGAGWTYFPAWRQQTAPGSCSYSAGANVMWRSAGNQSHPFTPFELIAESITRLPAFVKGLWIGGVSIRAFCKQNPYIKSAYGALPPPLFSLLQKQEKCNIMKMLESACFTCAKPLGGSNLQRSTHSCSRFRYILFRIVCA